MDKKPHEYIKYSKKPELKRCSLVNCKKLNVRIKPYIGADVLCVVDSSSTIRISIENSTGKWYSVKVRQDGKNISGYCLKEYLAVN